ncbi:ECF transporter S component [Periweissella cryptocerci]|uniref:Riboflavin transporter n=1 Tax=Periweissella cryptocerci TaxID=2506420 RepID=A0A4P6YR02_9LACO|nr:ECF transporter S component [Periweissella cryptocerci]QBO35049.1 ECF transporter S component [Periweissella cryptocerci]
MQKVSSVSSTRRLVVIALLSALSAVLMIFPKIPMFGFMSLDFSVVVVIIGMAMLGLPSALTILVIRSILKMLINNSGVNDWIGMPMNIVAMGLFITGIWLFIRKSEDIKVSQYILGSIVGTLVLTVVMAFLNWVYAIPLYEIFAHFSVGPFSKYLVGIVLPFNLIQGVALSLVSGLVLFPMLGYIKRQKQQF